MIIISIQHLGETYLTSNQIVMASKINKEWHEKHVMPKNPTFEERLEWHREHQKHCNCRPGFPKKLLEEMKKRGITP